jgi:hypothetical protein
MILYLNRLLFKKAFAIKFELRDGFKKIRRGSTGIPRELERELGGEDILVCIEVLEIRFTSGRERMSFKYLLNVMSTPGRTCNSTLLTVLSSDIQVTCCFSRRDTFVLVASLLDSLVLPSQLWEIN